MWPGRMNEIGIKGMREGIVRIVQMRIMSGRFVTDLWRACLVLHMVIEEFPDFGIYTHARDGNIYRKRYIDISAISFTFAIDQRQARRRLNSLTTPHQSTTFQTSSTPHSSRLCPLISTRRYS